MSEWENIDGLQQWTDKLGELLGAAKEAARNSDIETRLVVSDRLAEFIANSWPNDAAIKALDELAAKASQGLMLATIEERLREIAGRTAEWHLIVKQFREQAETAGMRAAEIRLQKAHRVVQSLTESVHLLKDLRGNFNDSEDPEFIKNLTKGLEMLQKLRSQIEQGG